MTLSLVPLAILFCPGSWLRQWDFNTPKTVHRTIISSLVRVGVCSIFLARGFFSHILFKQGWGIFASPTWKSERAIQRVKWLVMYTQLQQEGGCMQEGREAGAEWDKNSDVPAGLEASVVISGLTCPSPDWLAHHDTAADSRGNWNLFRA